MRLGQVSQDIGCTFRPHRGSRSRDDLIALPNQVVTHVEGDGYAVLPVQRLHPIAIGIAVLNIVVNQGCLVEDLDRECGSEDLVREFQPIVSRGRIGAVAAGQGIVYREGNERSGPFPAPGQEIKGNGFRACDRVRHGCRTEAPVGGALVALIPDSRGERSSSGLGGESFKVLFLKDAVGRA